MDGGRSGRRIAKTWDCWCQLSIELKFNDCRELSNWCELMIELEFNKFRELSNRTNL